MLRIQKTPAGLGLVATENIAEGRVVIDFTGQLLRTSRVSRFHHAIQVGRDRFLEAAPEALDNYINHSCTPTCRVDFDQLALISMQFIPAGWEISFDYETTEYDLESQGCAFACKCGSYHCRRQIRGFRHLRVPVQLSLRERLAPYLAEELDAQWRAGADHLVVRHRRI
jgi:hypothetical protein